LKKKFLLFGATGSIGDSTLDILRQHGDAFELVGFTYHGNSDKAASIAREFSVKNFFSTQALDTTDQARRMLDTPHDFSINAIVGAAGAATTLEAAARGDTILLANKESLIVAGDLVMSTVKRCGAKLLPIDSEHSSLWRILAADGQPKCVYLTASGGPLLHVHGDDFYNAPKSLVLKHPTWVMGQKITVDSAGLTNKALEIIEAHHIFNLTYDKINAVIHPQSYVHAMVQHSDGTITQHVSQPDMRFPIAYAMFYPEASRETLEVRPPSAYPALEFYPVDEDKFRSFKLGREAGKKGGAYPAIYNAANEAAVAAFLADEIRFGEIAELIERALGETYSEYDTTTLEGLMQYDKAARTVVKKQALTA